MKKKMKLIIALIVIAVIPIAIVLYLKLGNGNISDGTYHIVGNGEFPDAYIVVKGKTIQLYNIDLNSYWRQKQYDRIVKMQNSEALGFSTGLSDEQLWAAADLNAMFVDNSYEYDPDLQKKTGTYEYEYPCLSTGNLFGVFLTYDSWNKTICVENMGIQLNFER